MFTANVAQPVATKGVTFASPTHARRNRSFCGLKGLSGQLKQLK
jgi:hypothetical protein